MKSRINPFVALALLAVSSSPVHASLYWNANSGSPDYTGTWDEVTSNWNTATGGAGTQTTWVGPDDAEFDVNQSYAVTVDITPTVNALNVRAGTVTLSGIGTVSSTGINISSGATLAGAGDRYLKVGTTSLTVDGTLDYNTSVSASTRRVSIAGGTGQILLNGTMRIGGAITFAGDISGTGSFITDAGGVISLSGNNTYAGESLFRSGNTIRLGSATALSANTFVRTGGGCVFELTHSNFSREIATSGAGKMRVGNAADVSASTFGFAAVNDDREVALTGTVSWNTNNFNPSALYLGTAASTHKVNLTTDINLAGASRSFGSTNGAAEVEGEISGVISGATGSVLNKIGTGVLLLSNANTYPGGTTIAGSQGAANPLRLSNSSAAGTGAITIGSGGNNDQSRLELIGGVTVANPIPALTTRNNDAPNIINVSGDNTISSNISAGGGGSRTTFTSAEGKLVFSGSVSVRQLNLFGSGDGEISGNLTNAAGYSLNKSGTGKWTIGGNVSNGTSVTIGGGTLQIGKGGTTGSLGTAPLINNEGVLIFDRTGAVSIPGAISGSGSIIKRGSSEITLSGTTISHTGDTSIEDGMIVLSGNATAATGAVKVGDGNGASDSAILSGTGPAGGAVVLSSDGAIQPGVSVGTLTTLSSVSGNGSLRIEVDGATSDQLVVGGTLDITSMKLDLSVLNAATESAYVIVNASSAITGAAFASVAGIPSGYSIAYNYNDGVDTHNIALVSTGGSPFTNWATTTHGLAGGDAAPGADPDADGLSNLIEFVLGGQPNPANANASSNSLVPTQEIVGGNLVFTYRRTDLSTTEPGLAVSVEYGTNLSGWTTAVDGVGGVSVTTTDDGFGAGVDKVEVSIPRGSFTELFARLKAVLP